LSRIAPARGVGVGGVGDGLAMATPDSAQSAAVSNSIFLVLWSSIILGLCAQLIYEKQK